MSGFAALRSGHLAALAAGAALGAAAHAILNRTTAVPRQNRPRVTGTVAAFRRVNARLAFADLEGGQQVCFDSNFLDGNASVPRRSQIKPGTHLVAHCVEVVHKGSAKLVVTSFAATHSEDHDQEAAERQRRHDKRVQLKERNRGECNGGYDRLAAARPSVLRRRTSRLVLVLERSCDIHNHSAVMRTAECFGIQHVYIVDPVEFRSTGSKKISRQSTEWIDVKHFKTPSACIRVLKEEGWTIWATDLSPTAVSIEEGTLQVPERVALVIGREADGVSLEMLEASDRRVYFPLHGWSDSLNLSVAAAVIMARLFWMDPSLRGAMREEERARLRRRWFAKLARTEEQRRAFPLWVDSPPPPTEDCRKDDDQRVPHVRPRIVKRTRAKELELEAQESGAVDAEGDVGAGGGAGAARGEAE